MSVQACGTKLPSGQDAARTIPAHLLCTENVPEHPPDQFDLRNHVVMADSRGGFVDIGPAPDSHEGSNHFQAQFRRLLDAYATWREQRASDASPGRVLMFLNGGLNSASFSLARARKQVPCMLRAGYYPIFLVLQTDQYSSYWEGTSLIRGGEESETLQPTTPFEFVGDLGEGIARMPARLIEQFIRLIDSVDDGSSGDTENSSSTARQSRLNVQFDPATHNDGDKIGDIFVALGTTPVKAITTPLVDSMGDAAWTNMVRRSLTAIRHADEFNGNHSPELSSRYPMGTGVFSVFFAELTRCVQADPECWSSAAAKVLLDTEITLIAHSLGTITAGELVRRYPDLPYRRIVYMAAACSTQQFMDTVAPVLASHPKIEFYSLSLHPSADLGDTYGFGTAPTGSLLEWIDSMYADAPTMMDRTFGKWRNVAAVAHVFPDNITDQMFFRIFGFRKPDPSRNDPGDPVSHGDFTKAEMHYWLPGFWGASNDPSVVAAN